MQLVKRWFVAFWYVLAGHAMQVRCAVLESGDILSPLPQVGCAVHDVLRWLVKVWNVLAGHALHVRAAVLLSAEII